MSFLPNDYSIPKSDSKYMKFTEPENRFRVLASAVVGFELWVNSKPRRNKKADAFTQEELEGADINKFTGERKTPQYFWAFPVYNYQTKRIEILEIIQVTIMRGIEDYLNDKDYGDPKEYDLTVIRDDSTEKIKYRVKPSPPKELDKAIKDEFDETTINLEGLFDGSDPFKEVEVNVDDIPEDLGK